MLLLDLWRRPRSTLFPYTTLFRSGQRLYGDPQLRAQIESALAYVPTYYGRTTLPLGNWWFWSLGVPLDLGPTLVLMRDRKSTRLNSSHVAISYAVFCLKKKNRTTA